MKLLAGGKFKTRLTLVTLIVSLIALGLQAAAFAVYERMRVSNQLVQDMTSMARIVADRSSAALVFNDDKVARDTLRALKIKESVRAACIYDLEGRLFASYEDGEESCAPQAQLQSGPHLEWKGRDLLLLHPVQEDGVIMGVVLIQSRFGELDVFWRNYLWVASLIALLTLAITLFLAHLLQRQISDPIEHLSATAQRISSEQDYSLRARIEGRDEIGTLVRFFNDMLDGLEERNSALLESNRRLSDSEQQLKTVNAGLEQRVRARTAELASQNSLLDALLDTIPNAIFYKGEDTRFIGCNLAYEATFGVRRRDFIGKRVLDLEYLPAADRQAYQAEDEKVIREIGRVVREVPMVFADGQVHDTLYSVTGFPGADGRPGGLIGVIVDISALKQAERDAHDARLQAEEASRMKSDFLATMSHEIRTPMNAIIGMLYLALGTELSPAQHNYLSKAQGAAHSLLGIINDILDFSKIEAGRLELEAVEFGLDTVLEQLKDTVVLQAEQKGIEFLIRYDVGIPPLLVGDPLRLGQVMLNLCSNAIKFTDEGEVELAFRCIANQDNEVMLHFSVRDTGIGMDAELVTRLFQKFTQADQSTTRRFGGTGLGLAISRQLVELMGGRLWIEDSRPGQGTTVCCTVRLGIARDAQSRGLQLTTQAGSLLQGIRVLVVDDNEVSREILAEMLRYFRLDVRIAAHGAGALELLENPDAAPADIVLMDWRMPQMNGDELARRIQASSAIEPKPRLVMVTAYGREEVIRSARMAGVDSILIKPVSPSMLLDTLMISLGRGRVIAGQKEGRSHRHYCDFGGARLLLVEDNEINREFATELLRHMNTQVDCAVNGAEAVRKVQAQRYDAVLMDIQMPVMDGLEAARRIRALAEQTGNAGLRQLPIIAMTALAMSRDKEKSLAAGMNDHVSKPIAPDQLQRVLAKWLGQAESQLENLAPLEEPPLPDDLARLQQLNATQGVSRIGGDSEAYRKQLRRFRSRYADAHDQLQALIDGGDLQQAEEYCHALKGVCGNLGADQLFARLNAIDQALKYATPPHPTDLKVFADLLEKAMLDIDQLGSSEHNPAANGKLPADSDLLATLRQLRHSLDTDLGLAPPLLASLRDTRGPWNAPLQRIAEKVDLFDLDAAGKELDALLEELEKAGSKAG